MVNDTSGRRPALATDGGEEFYEDDESIEVYDDDYVEHYPDPFAEGAGEPYQQEYLPEYEPEPHFLLQIFEKMAADRTLLYSSDYPH